MTIDTATAPPPSPPSATVEEPPTIVIRASRGISALQLRAVWEYRELLYFLVWRDVKVRYKQTVLGVLWIVLQPVVAIIIFSGLFGRLLGVPSGGVPYPIFLYSALLPWSYFASSLNRSSTSLVGSAHLITKVYFPRLVIPISGVLSGLVDFGVAFAVLAALMAYYRIVPTPAIFFLPGFLLLAMLTALGFGLWLSALNVRYRDINHLIPYIVQMWMYVTPVIYSTTLIPERFRWVLALNPMTGVVEGFRWALLGNYLQEVKPPGALFPISALITIIVLATGLYFFRSTERTFADII
ncbi:MAG: ABC transporter permease [Chloroflexi bacterium]|nr:ABC transporter permease [Chloroflexota bacterium]